MKFQSILDILEYSYGKSYGFTASALADVMTWLGFAVKDALLLECLELVVTMGD